MTRHHTTDSVFDEASGLLLSRPERIFVRSYIQALQEGLQPARHCKTVDEIIGLQNGDSDTWNMFAKTCPNSIGTDNACMEDMFWLTKQNEFIGYIMLRTDMGPLRQQYGGNTGRVFRPPECNKGYGTIALGMTQTLAAKRGYTHLEMVTSVDNIAAIRPWEKCGATFIERLEHTSKSYYSGAAVKYRILLERTTS